MTVDAEPLSIVVACDTSYARHLAVTLRSILAHLNDKSVKFYIIVPSDFSAEAKLLESVGRFSESLNFIHVRAGVIPGLKLFRNVSISAYHRLLVGDLLPLDIRRVIYFDCDLVVRGNIDALWSMDLLGCVIAAVPDRSFGHHTVLGISNQAAYFNSGVMVIDLDRWRQQSVGRRTLEFAAERPDRLTWADQCALNWILRDSWLPLDRKFNVQSIDLGDEGSHGFAFYTKTRALKAEIAIVHFTGAPHPAYGKPWSFMCEHPLKDEYKLYARLTSWRSSPQCDLTAFNVGRKYLRRYIPAAIPSYHKMRRLIIGEVGRGFRKLSL